MQSLFQGQRGKNTMTQRIKIALEMRNGDIFRIEDGYTKDLYQIVKGKTGFRLRRVDE